MKKIFTIILILFCFINSSFGLTLEEAKKYALKNSNSFKSVLENSKILKAGSRKALYSTLPKLSLSSQYLNLDTDAPENPAEPYPDKNIKYALSLSQGIYTGGKILNNLKLKTNLFKQAKISEKLGKRDIENLVTSAFNYVLLQKQAVEIEKDREEQRKAEFLDTKKLNKLGLANPLNLRAAELSFLSAKSSHYTAKTNYNTAVLNLANLISYDIKKNNLEIEGKLEDTFNLDDIVLKLEDKIKKESFFELSSYDLKINEQKNNYNISKAYRLPEVNLIASYEKSGEKTSDMNASTSIGFQLTFNILDGGASKYQVSAAKSALKLAKISFNAKKEELIKDAKNIISDINYVKEQIKLLEDAVLLSKNNYKDARRQYNLGIITRTQLSEYNLSYSEIRYNFLSLLYAKKELINKANKLLFN